MNRSVFQTPNGVRSANELGDDAAQAIRGINHLTGDDGSLRYPSEVYTLLGDLSHLSHMLPQALRQIDAIVTRWVEAGDVSIDGSDVTGHPEAAAAAVSVYLEDAAQLAARLGEVLGRAQSALSAASWTGPDRESEA